MDLFLHSFAYMLTTETWLWGTIGAVAGIIFGILPGIGGTLAVALTLPVTYALGPVPSLVLLGSVYCAAQYGGSIPAILLNVPGTDGSAVTTIDGHPLAKQGKAAVALGASATASLLGGLAGVAALAIISPMLASVALLFGPPEVFAMATLGLTLVAIVSKESLVKGLIAALMGLGIGVVGYDLITGTVRYSFGWVYLEGGISLIPVLIGVFAMSEVLLLSERTGNRRISNAAQVAGSTLDGIVSVFKNLGTVVRASVVAIVVGIVPGVGTVPSNFLAYYVERLRYGHRVPFGNGAIQGVIAPEASDNACTPATLIPTLTMGIPGNGAAAIFIGALTIQGLAPGPSLFLGEATLVAPLIAGLIVAQFSFFFIGLACSGLFAKVTRVPITYVIPIIFSLSLLGAYAVRNNLTDALFALAFGLLGAVMRKLDYPVVALVIGLVLGPIMEKTYNQSLIMGRGSWKIFMARPITATILVSVVLILLLPWVYQKMIAPRIGWRQGRVES